MSEQKYDRKRLIKNGLIAAFGGMIVGITIGAINKIFPDTIPRAIVLGSVGASIGAIFVVLQGLGRKTE